MGLPARVAAARWTTSFRRLQLVSAGCTAWVTAATTRRRRSASSGCCSFRPATRRRATRIRRAWVIWCCYIAIGLGHPVRRLAHREDDGPEAHQAQTRQRLLCRDGRRHHACSASALGIPVSTTTPSPGPSSASARCAAARSAGAGRQHRLGLDFTIPAWPSSRRSSTRSAWRCSTEGCGRLRRARYRRSAGSKAGHGGHQHPGAEQQRERGADHWPPVRCATPPRRR